MAEPSKTRTRGTLGPVLLVNFIGTLGYTIAIPFMVFLVTRFGGNAFVYGIVAAAYSVFQFLAAPVLGRWSDRRGRRKILLLSQIGTLVSWIIFGVALFLPDAALFSVDAPLVGAFTVSAPLLAIVVARALDGLTGGNISVANAYVADISTDADRSRNFGRMGVAANMGMILGPALAGVLGATALGETLPVMAAAAVSLVAAVFIAVALPESKRCLEPPGGRREEAAQILGQECRDCMAAAEAKRCRKAQVWRNPNVFFMLTLYFLIMLSFNFFYTAFPMHAAANLGWTVAKMGAFFASLSFLLVVVQSAALPWLAKRFPEPALIIAGLFFLGAGFALMRSHDIVLLYLAAAFFAMGNGVMWPSVVSMVSKVAGDEAQGEVQGLAGSAGSLASIIGLVLGGVAFSAIGAGTFLIAAGLAYLSFFLSMRLPKLELVSKPAR